MQKPKLSCMQSNNKILRYLNGIVDHGMLFLKHDGFFDSYYCRDFELRGSVKV